MSIRVLFMLIRVAPQAKIFMSIRVSFMHIRVAPQAEKLFTTHSRFIHAHSCCAAGEKSTLVYNFLAPIYRWYMLVYRPYTDGISPIYRWYIAYIPMVYRLYTDGISPIYQLSASRHEEKLLLPAQILAWCLSEMFFEHSGEVLWVFESQLLGRVWASACQPPLRPPRGLL